MKLRLRMAAGITVVIALLAGALGSVPSAQAAGGVTYKVSANVNIRAWPGTSYAVVGSAAKNTSQTFDCYSYGTAVGANNNKIWGHLANGRGYISDVYIAEGGKTLASAGIPQCVASVNRGMIGFVDAAYGTYVNLYGEGNRPAVHIQGWAANPDQPALSGIIKIVIATNRGVATYELVPSAYRPDVNQVFPGLGTNHGFSYNLLTLNGGCGKTTVTVTQTFYDRPNTTLMLNQGQATFTIKC